MKLLAPRVVAAVVALLFCAPAWAKKVDALQKLVTAGKCSEIVVKVDDWEAKAALGEEEADLKRMRAEAAFCVAKQADTLPAWEAFLGRYPDAPDAKAARERLLEIAFSAAQSEGTSAAMKAFIARYPDSPYVDRARKQEEAWAFDDAARQGTPEAIRVFIAEHPGSSMREQAWEALVQTTPGIYLLTAGAEPRPLEGVEVRGDTLVMPVGVPSADALPIVGVNLPGAGRGETSEWWALRGIAYDGEGVPRLVDASPLGAALGARLAAEPPGPGAGLLTMIRAPGSHVARVATTRSPLALPGHCAGFARFAFVLTTPGQGAMAYPFGVNCPQTEPAPSSIGLVLEMLDAAEAGDRPTARSKWAAFLARADSEALREWLFVAAAGDPYKVFVEDRPAAGDWVVWTTQTDGSLISSWVRADEEGTRVLAMRGGWAVIANDALRTTVGDPACERLAGSIGATLFCAADVAPHIFSFEATPLPFVMPSAEALASAGFVPPPSVEKVVAVGPRWRDGVLMGAWRVRTSVQADVLAAAPAEWAEALGATPALGRWLATNAGSSPFGASRVRANAAAIYGAFQGP